MNEIDPIEIFGTYEQAETWMLEQVDDSCVDNYRFAYLDDDMAMCEYFEKLHGGCCGYFDIEIVVGGRKATIGCNYGH